MTLYATDLDGTLLRSDATIADDTCDTLNRLISGGVQFTYATARSYASASPLLKKLNLKCPAATFNGVFVVDPQTGEHIIENIPDKQALDFAKRFFTENKIAPLVYSYIGGRERVSYLSDTTPAVQGYVDLRKGDKRLRPVKSMRELFRGNIFYFTVLDFAYHWELQDVFTRERGFSFNIQRDTYDNSVWHEIYSSSASKASAVLQIKELVGADELVCFGDNNNDLSMILAADIGAAVGNSCESLLRDSDIVIGTNDEGAVADFIAKRERLPQKADARSSGEGADFGAGGERLLDYGENRFSQALGAAMMRERGMHGSVGTQNEKLIHAALKNYYCPNESGQEIRIGRFFADAVNEDGVYEIQTRSLSRLREKLRVFTAAAHVTVVYPVEAESRTVYISSDTGEIVKETPCRRSDPKVKIFKELYSIREFLPDENLTVILAKIKVDKRVYFSGSELPDLRSRSVRKRLYIEKIPLALLEEKRLSCRLDYEAWLPKNLPQEFTKKQFAAAAKESAQSLRLEVLRTVGVIVQTGKNGREYLYRCKG